MVSACYYELLGVDRSATKEELRTAYRKQALKLHPDKNCASERATFEEQFKQLHHAYDILSDEASRAWYDKNRQQIIASYNNNGDGGRWDDDISNSRKDDIDLFPYFSRSCFSGFGESEKNDNSSSNQGVKDFFTVYGDLFAHLAEIEHDAWMFRQEEESQISSSLNNYEHLPPFGSSNSLWEGTTREFYARWESFVTCRSFYEYFVYSVHDLKKVPRSVRRKMEEENKKVQKKKRREYWELVRELVRLVKKRDPRVAKRKEDIEKRELEKKREKEEKLQSELQKKLILEKEKEKQRVEEEENCESEDEELAKMLDFNFEYDGRGENAGTGEDGNDCDHHSNEGDNGNDTHGSTEKCPENLYCIVCKKRFKSTKQWINHEKSKKHIELVALLQQSLLEDEMIPGVNKHGNSNNRSNTSNKEANDELRENESDMVECSSPNVGDSGKERRAQASDARNVENHHRDNQNDNQNSLCAPNDVDDADIDDEIDDETILQRMVASKAEVSEATVNDSFNGDGEFSYNESSQNDASNIDTEILAENTYLEDDAYDKKCSEEEMKGSRKVRKARRRKQKIDKSEPTHTQENIGRMKSSGEKIKDKALREDYLCKVCGMDFSSRTQLFKHIKKTGHASIKG